jgi:hypothetical protein
MEESSARKVDYKYNEVGRRPFFHNDVFFMPIYTVPPEKKIVKRNFDLF